MTGTARPTAIAVVSFDGDDTLWSFQQMVHSGLTAVLRELAALPDGHTSPVTLDDLDAIYAEAAATDPLAGTAGRAFERRRAASFALLATRVGADAAFGDHLFRTYQRHRHDCIPFFDDALPAIRAVRDQYRIGILTNGVTDPHEHGHAGAFDFVLRSDDIGAQKPEPAAFDALLAAAGCGPDRIVHIGDSLEHDVQGARLAGIRSVWLNRSGAPNPTTVRPDHEIRTLADLPALL